MLNVYSYSICNMYINLNETISAMVKKTKQNEPM